MSGKEQASILLMDYAEKVSADSDPFYSKEKKER